MEGRFAFERSRLRRWNGKEGGVRKLLVEVRGVEKEVGFKD